MTEISYIHGIKRDMNPVEAAQRSRGIPAPSYINFPAMTEGEMRLTLLLEQLNILAGFYPENKDFLDGREMIIDALHEGIHGGVGVGMPVGRIADGLNKVVATIRRAKSETSPAAKIIVGRKSLQKGIGDPLVPNLECTREVEISPGEFTTVQDTDCVAQNEWRERLNVHLEKMAHHPLYEFMQNPNASTITVGTKTVLHKAGISTIAELTSIKRELIRMWQRNGVMRHNALAETEPWTPEQTIQIILQASQEGIGFPIAGILKVLNVILAAIGGAIGFKKSLKFQEQQRFLTQVNGWGTPGFGPQKADFLNSSVPGGGLPSGPQLPGSGTQLSNILSGNNLPLLIGGAALLLLSK